MRAAKVLSFCCVMMWWHLVLVPPAEASETPWSTALQEARALRESDQWPSALEKYDEASDLAAQSEPRIRVQDMERVLWERAEAYDAFAHKELGPRTKRDYANKAATFWKDYISWYGSLSSEESAALGDPRSRGSQHRICRATVLLGQSLVNAAEVDRLFDEYENMPAPHYLNMEAIALWKTWLYADPSLGQTPQGQRTNAMRVQAISIRPMRWRAYGRFLETWAGAFYLTSVKREEYREEARKIINATKDIEEM